MKRKPIGNAFLPSLAAYPLLWLSVFYVYMARSHLRLGHIPRSVIEDSQLEGSIHHFLVIYGFILIPIVFIAYCLPVLVGWRFANPLWRNRSIGIAMASVLLLLALFKFDPGGCVEWLLD